MKKRHSRFLFTILATVILLSLQLIMDVQVSAADAERENSYGNPVTYAPRPLNAGGQELMFFDYDMTIYDKEVVTKSKSSQQLSVLNSYKLNLNKFGSYRSSGSYGDTNKKDPFNGAISNDDMDEDFKVYYDFRRILVGRSGGYTQGNIKNMLDKGDLKFAFAYRVFVRRYTQDGIKSKNKSAIAEINIFGETKRFTGTDGNRWERVNYTVNSDKEYDKLNLTGSSTWKDWGGNNLIMSYYGSSYNGGPVHTEMENGVLVGRDYNGPRIKAVNLSYSKNGPWEYNPDGTENSNWRGAEAVKDDKIGDKVYIGVIFDEPVKFDKDYDSPEELADLKLTIQTTGRDGSDAMPLDADFLEYAPDANTSAPVMIFEYEIQDPQSSIRKDLYYELSSVNISSSVNSAIYNHLTDMAGNAYGERNGSRSGSYSVPFSNRKSERGEWVSAKTAVDFEPFIVESVTITRSSNIDEYLTKDDTLTITINYNKIRAIGDRMPEIALNIDDGSGNYVKPLFNRIQETRIGGNGHLRTSLSYKFAFYWRPGNYTAEGPVRLQSISIPDGETEMDESGYLLTIPEIMPAFDKNYYVDFKAPVINADFSEEENNIFKITATVSDASLHGRDAAFSVTTNLDSISAMQYQVSTNGSYGPDWKNATGKDFSVNAPLVPLGEADTKNAYLFIKLPESDAQMSGLGTNIYVTDAAGNVGYGFAGHRFDPPLDTVAPKVELERRYKKDGFSIVLKAFDNSGSMTYRCAWIDNHNADYPSAWTEEGSIRNEYKSLEYNYAENGMTENEIYYRTLWVEVEDGSGNKTARFLNLTFDNQSSEIYVESISPEETGDIIKDIDLSATVSFKNAEEYAHAWIEWGTEFEEDGGEFFKNNAITHKDGNVFRGAWNEIGTTTPASVTFTLDSSTLVWRNYDSSGAGYSYGWDSAGQAKSSEISGPIVLAICSRYHSEIEGVDRYTFEFIPFNTRYAPGNYDVQLVRFSTNDAGGNRIDREFKSFVDYFEDSWPHYGYGLYYPESPGSVLLDAINLSLSDSMAQGVRPTALNTTPLHDFAEAGFVLKDDPVLGLESLKLTGEPGGTRVILKKVIFQSDGSMEPSATGDPGTDYDYSFRFNNETVESEETIQTWYLTESMLNLAEGNSRLGRSRLLPDGNNSMYLMDYSFTLPVDISLITPYAYDEEGNLIRYEFWIEYEYQDQYGPIDRSEILTMFAFENRTPGLIFESVKTADNDFGETDMAVRANLTTEGEGIDTRIIDNTVSAHRVFFKGDDPQLILKVDMPDSAFNMLYKYSISGEYISDPPGMTDYPSTIAPGHNYHVLYGTAEDLQVDGQSITIDCEQPAQCQEGSFAIELANLFEDIGGTLAEGETLSAYYQLVNEYLIKVAGEFPGELTYLPVRRYSPVYRIDLTRDETPPEIILNVSEREAANNDVTVTIQTVRDGRIKNEGGAEEHYIMDTPAADIEVSVTAEYEDGASVQPENGAYIFSRNGRIEVTAVDKAGNAAEVSHVIDYIDREAPVVDHSYAINRDNGSFTINADITGDDTDDAYITFDSAYTAHLLDVPAGDITSPIRFPVKGSEAYGIFMQNEWIPGEVIDRIELLVYAKSGVRLSSAVLHVTDAAGNDAQIDLELNIDGKAPAVTNPDKVYTYGNALTFSVPVKLTNPVGSEKGYSDTYENLPIYKDGPVMVSYTDLFGRSYAEQITADIFGEAYAHDITITPDGPTNSNVTVKIDTTGHNTTVLDGVDENNLTIVVSDNRNIEYTIVPDDTAISPMTFIIPISNIDRTAPTALYTRTVNGEESFDGDGKSTVTGSVTYTIIGFDEDNVAMDEGQSINVTFTEPGVHTFSFTDAAGNRGELTVSENDTVFLPHIDLNIAKLRLTYTMSGSGTGPVQLGRHDSDEAAPVLMPTNKDISVYVQALNAAGDVIPAAMEPPAVPVDGVEYYYLQNTLVFTESSAAAVTVKTTAGSQRSITIMIPEGTIDKIPPVGTVEYVMLTEDEILPDGTVFERGTVKAYLDTEETDVEVSGIDVRYDPEDGRYYIHFAENGSGKFYLTDKAGNTSIVMAGAYSIDNTPPGITSESWYSSIAAKPGTDDGTSGNNRDDILSTVTSNSIRLFFVFDELIRNVEISALFAETGLEIPAGMLGSYISYTHSANTLNIEFKQNCQAQITVYDLRGNSVYLIRPEDGPVTVIDKKPPEYTAGTPVVENNVVSITYTFDEEVASANTASEYKQEHTLTFDKNGVYTLIFADRAGNVANIIANINQIDDESPAIYYALKIVPETAGILYSDEARTQPAATNGSVEIAIAAEDVSGASIQVFNQNKPGSPLELHAPTIGDGASRSYTDAITAEENGVYRISAADVYGNTNTVYIKISFIDKEAPYISMESTKPIYVAAGTDESVLSQLLLEGVSAKDGREGNLTSKITVDISGVDLSREGLYTVVYRVEDGLGNAAARERKVSVTGSAVNSLTIAGTPVPANDVYVTTPGEISVSAPAGYTLYASEGYMTRAQMKYAPMLTGNLNAVNKGYYTILAQSGDRDSIIVYVYVY